MTQEQKKVSAIGPLWLLTHEVPYRMYHRLLRTTVFGYLERKVRERRGNQAITDLQPNLVPLVQQLYREGKICFTSATAEGSPDGNNWVPLSIHNGTWLWQLDERLGSFDFHLYRRIVRDYQTVIREAQRQGLTSQSVDVPAGKHWVLTSLLKWSGPAVSAGLLAYSEVRTLALELEQAMTEKGEGFFGFAHGNVIGDHILCDLEGATRYLFGMRIVLRPGRGYYDYLRALDWLILKSAHAAKHEERIVAEVRSLFREEDEAEVRLVFALRCLGILGWDMLHRGDEGAGNVQAKWRMLFRFIRRKY